MGSIEHEHRDVRVVLVELSNQSIVEELLFVRRDIVVILGRGGLK